MTAFAPKDATEYVVPKLKEGDEYKFRVQAENVSGLSEPLETDRATKAKNPFGKQDIMFKKVGLGNLVE